MTKKLSSLFIIFLSMMAMTSSTVILPDWGLVNGASALYSPSSLRAAILALSSSFIGPYIVVLPLSRLSVEAFPVHDNLAAVARACDVKGFPEFRDGVSVGDDSGDVQTGTDEGGHGVPRFEDLTPGHSLNCDHVKDDLGKVEGDVSARGSQQRNPSTMSHIVNHGC